MDILSIFVVLILCFCELVLTRIIGPKFPYITVDDGNLRFVASDGRNISFETSTRVGGLWVNNMDLLITLNRAHNATKLIEKYQNLFTTYDDRIDALEQRVSDPLFVQNKTNTSTITEVPDRRINRRLTMLIRRYNDLRTSLLKDDCANNPCKNGGRCQDMFENYLCQCRDGWEGPDCVVDVNECSQYAGTDLGCQNGATCINKPGTYECLCPPGFVGIHCTRRKVDCTLGGSELCGHGTCVPQNNQLGYKCICDQGWKTDGINAACVVDVNECSLNHPSCSAHPPVPCINVPGSYYCGACPQGYTGNGYYCADIDECAINNGGCSVSPTVQCMNTLGSRVCGLCPPGYAGDGTTCAFRGICNVDNGGCHHLAQCRDNPRISSTFVECICPLGYVGSGKGPNGCLLSSSTSDPCSSNPCLFGDCSTNNVTGDYICNCRRRYTGRNCDILKDPCSSNPCLNGGTCQNLLQLSYKCICASGFVGATCEAEAQACGGQLRALSGTLKYPPDDYATYGHRLSCAWTIETNASKILDINFKKFDIENSTGCRFDWLQIHDGRHSASRSLGKFCGDKLPLGGRILSTHNIIYMWFRSDGRTAKSGFELTWNSTEPKCGGTYLGISHGSLESPGSPGVYPLNRDCYWLLWAPHGKRFIFHFYSLMIGENANCNSDYLEFYATLDNVDDSTFAKFCNSSKPSPFYSPGRIAAIHFHSDNKDSYPGFQLTYSITPGIPGCGGVYTEREGTIESVQPHDATTYLCDYKIQQPVNSKIKITFLSLNLRESVSCEDEYVELRDGPNSDSPLVGRYCDDLPTPYVSLSNELTIVSLTSKDTKGWKIKYNKVCGNKFTNTTGSFKIPLASSAGEDCIYRIERPAGSVIELILKTFSPYLSTCVNHYIEIRDGDDENANLIQKYCGNASEVITSTYNHLWIRAYHQSIEAIYTSIDKGCGGVLKDKIGNIASPTHPDGYYPGQAKCTWVIIAPRGNIIQLTWLTFNLEQSYECTYDNVRVYDNNTEPGMGGLMGPYCGSTRPPILMSSSNIMTVVFTTDVTIHMDGFLASYTFIPETKVCGGNYFTPSGVIKSPGYPKDYPNDRECTWTITVPRGQQIMLNVSDFNIESYSSCIYDWLEIRNGGTSASPLIDRYCGTKIPKQIPSHANQLYLYFKSDINRSGHGFKINWFSTATGCGGTLSSPIGSIISPNYPEPYGRNTECLWKIIVNAGSRIQVVFADINLETHNRCSADYVQLFEGLTTNSKSLGKYCIGGGSPILTNGSQMLVKFRSDAAYQGRGFQLHYITVCKNTVKGYRGVIESPNFPNNYPQDLECTWDIKVSDRNKINITFSHFDLERTFLVAQNNSCTTSYVEIKYESMEDENVDEDSANFLKQGKYCLSDNPGQITLDSDHAQIHYVTDKLLVGSGFRLEWQIFGCGGILTHRSGKIESPNYPKPYPPLIKCEWQIQVDFGYSIEIEFKEIDIEKDSCEYDSIKVYNGLDNTYNLLAILCHQIKPVIISSTGNFMFLEFTSDYSYHGRGFTANYSTVSTKCGGRFTAPAGTIFTPNYPKNYDKNDTCYWLIDIDENHSIELDFEDVDLYQSNCQQNNYIKVYDGPTAAYPVLETICGNNKPNKTIKSTYNEMFIEFRSNIFITTKGFLAKYRKACGSRITTQGTGTIKIDHNEFSDNIANCTWTIVSTDPSRHVSLTISHMLKQPLYYDESDDDGTISVYGGESTSSPLLGRYTGHKTPPTLVSDGSAMTISLEHEMDFFATYSVLDSHCGGTLTSGGYFATPGYPKTYAFDTQCEWTLQVAPGNHVSLSFIYFELLASEHCNMDYLEMRELNSTGKLLGIYCGKNKPVNITHEGSMWLMYKGSKRDADATDITAKGFYGEFTLDETNELSGPKGVVASPMYPSSYHKMYGSYSWKITVATGKRILITFKEFYLESNPDDDDECYFSSLCVYDGVDDTANTLKLLCGQDIPDPIKSSSNIIFLKMDVNSDRMGSKFVLEWLEISNVFQPTTDAAPPIAGCGSADVIQINTLHNYTITSPGYPESYKPSLNCEWIFFTTPGNHLIIYFLDMNLKNYLMYSQLCNADYVTLYQKSSLDNDWKLLKTVCRREDHNNEFIHSTDLLKVNFVTNRYLHGTGFKAKVLEGCGGLLTESTGYIIFNNSTLRSSECQWNITVRSGRTIELTFVEMNIAHNANKGCNFYLMIRNGKYPDSPLLGNGKYCGTELPDPLRSTGNYLYLKYSGLPNIVGFRLKYKEISTSCGDEIRLTQFERSAEINSVNYPNIPPPHSECSWLVSGPPGESFRVEFEERFDLTSTRNCEIEYVELRDGGTESSPLIGRFCKDIPSTQFSTGNIMLIKFFTNTEDPKNGFKAKITLAYCGGTIRGREGEIKPPMSQTVSAQNQNCTWHIIGPANHYLNLWFTKLKIKWLRHCFSTSLVTISEVHRVSNTVHKMGEYCGTTLPVLNRTVSNEVIVNYLGDNNDNFILKFNASRTDCGGILKQESGTIQSPGYPKMEEMRACTWKIEVPEGRRVTLNIEDFDLDETAHKHDQVLMIYDGSDKHKIRLAYLKPGDPTQIIESSSNKMQLQFWCVNYSNRRGFKASFSSDQPSICDGDFSGESNIITQPIVRNSTYSCQWIHNSNNLYLNETLALTVSLDTNSTQKKRSSTCLPYVATAIFVTNQDNTYIVPTLCSPTSNHIIRSPFYTTKIIAQAEARLQMNFTIAYNTYKCGGIINNQQGYISSPNFPNKPSKTFECAWILKVDKEQTINLTVVNDDLGNDCEKNFLSIYNGDLPTHPRIGRYCHNSKIEPIISQSNSLWLEYKWEKGSSGTGFKLKYEAIGGGCGGIYHYKSRRIQTPNYGKDYPNNAECLWEIRASQGHSIRLKFIERFHLEDSDKCENDYVEIWDWKNDKWISIKKICGRNIPADIQSTGEKLKILFRSNNKTTGSGFKAEWDWTCGGTFEATKIQRYIISPGYPVVYPKNLNCVYNITSTSDVMIIRFDDFELENGSSDCTYDNVTISGQYFLPRAFSKNPYCGTNKPPLQRMKGNVIVTFKTDGFINRKGFKFMYSDESCGGDINEETVIESQTLNDSTPTEFRFYRPRIRCTWRITAPGKKMVVLRVNELKMILTPVCFAQNVMIYNGLVQNYFNRLGTLCGDITEGEPITAESGKMLVMLEASPHSYRGFKAEVYFSHGPSEGCGGVINLNKSVTIQPPDLEDLDCSWKILAPRDYQVHIQITEINIPGTCSKNNSFVFCTCSFIQLRDGGGPISDEIDKLCSSSNGHTRNFTTSWNTAYIRFFLRGRQSNAFKAILTPVLSICGHSILNATEEMQTLNSPGYPNKYPPGVNCYWVFNTDLSDKIVLHFLDFDLKEEFGTSDVCSGDRIEIFEDPNNRIITEGLGPNALYVGARRSLSLNYNDVNGRHTFCGKNESAFDYYSSGKSITLSFKSTNSDDRGKGFKLEYSKVGCNRNYTSLQGRIVNNENDKTDCIITITVPANRTISLFFHQFFIAYSPNCSDTALEVRDDGPTGKELLKSCGYRMPNPVFSYTNKLYIRASHRSMPSYRTRRFDFSYTSTEHGRGCGGTIYNYKGRFSSPLYPNEFRNESICTWDVRVPVGLQVALKIISFDIQGDCDQTFLTIHTYSSDSVTSHNFCKGDRPSIMRSSTSRMEVTYVSSIHNGGTGWMAQYQGVTEGDTLS